jgi:hypothetical protein
LRVLPCILSERGSQRFQKITARRDLMLVFDCRVNLEMLLKANYLQRCQQLVSPLIEVGSTNCVGKASVNCYFGCRPGQGQIVGGKNLIFWRRNGLKIRFG